LGYARANNFLTKLVEGFAERYNNTNICGWNVRSLTTFITSVHYEVSGALAGGQCGYKINPRDMGSFSLHVVNGAFRMDILLLLLLNVFVNALYVDV